MDTFSMRDEVRFRVSPDIIKASPRSPSPPRPAPRRRARPQAVVNSQGLIELDLSGKTLRAVPSDTFTQLRIEVLNLSHNSLSAIPASISQLHRLRQLSAHHNHIQQLPDTIANLVHLVQLNLAHNRITVFPHTVSCMRSLRVLQLGHNDLETLPHELGNLLALQQLDLSHNKLWHLPHSLQSLQNLHYLNLSENSFDQVPVAVCCMRHLEALDMHRNHLLNLPADLAKLPSLRELNVAHNRLETVPHVVSLLKSLHSLDLSYNKIKVVSPRLAKLQRLRLLVLQGNHIVVFPSPTVGDTLHYLNVAENQIQNLSVVKMKNLKHLNVNSNMLENMPHGVYNLSNLEVLRLNSNRIAYVSQDIVLLSCLKVLDLGNNKLTSLPQVIDELENLETFNVKGNKIDNRTHPVTQLAGGLPYSGYPGQQAAPRYMPAMPGGNPAYGGYPVYPLGPELTNGGPPGHRTQANHSIYRKKSLKSGRSGVFTKKGSKWKTKKSLFSFMRKSKKKPSTTSSRVVHSRNTATQYTPKSTIRSRDRVPLDALAVVTETAAPNSTLSSTTHPAAAQSHKKTPDSYNNTQPHSLHSNMQGSHATTGHNNTNSNHKAISEISYPMASTPLQSPSKRPSHHTLSESYPVIDMSKVIKQNPLDDDSLHSQDAGSYTQDWVIDKRQPHPSNHSDIVTINEPVGDSLSLGDEDFEYQPTNLVDSKLLQLCSETESLLNNQLLKPLILGSPKSMSKSIFRKSFNEGGTSRTLHSMAAANSMALSDLDLYPEPAAPTPEPHPHTVSQPDGSVIHMSRDIFLKRPKEAPSSGLHRLKMDIFRVTPAGGMFKSSVDPGVCLYFPINAVDAPIAVTMQLERLTPRVLEEAKRTVAGLSNLLAVGDIVHIKQSRDIDFNQQVTLTIPAPPLMHYGKLHILSYRDDNTCTPCTSQHRMHGGYVTLHTWHFSGRGAVLTKSKDKHKACHAMEHLLRHLYV